MFHTRYYRGVGFYHNFTRAITGGIKEEEQDGFISDLNAIIEDDAAFRFKMYEITRDIENRNFAAMANEMICVSDITFRTMLYEKKDQHKAHRH